MKRTERKHEVTDLHVYRLSHDLFSISFLTAGEADHSMTMTREILDRFSNKAPKHYLRCGLEFLGSERAPGSPGETWAVCHQSS